MSSPPWPDGARPTDAGSGASDDELLRQLGLAFDDVDPVPDEAVEAAKEALSWRDPDAALAELVDDSALTGSSAGVRAGEGHGPRLLSFQAEGTTIEVQVAVRGVQRQLVGQLVPTGRADLDIRWADGHRTTETDELGRFAMDDLPAGPLSIACRRIGEDGWMATSWVQV